MRICTIEGVELHAVQQSDIDTYWFQAKGWIEKSIPYSTSKLTLEGAHAAVCKNSLQLWLALRQGTCVGAMITSLYRSDRGGTGLNFELIGMEGFDEFGPAMMGVVESHMKKHAGVALCRVIGRPGWQRKLKALGYTPTHFFTEKKL